MMKRLTGGDSEMTDLRIRERFRLRIFERLRRTVTVASDFSSARISGIRSPPAKGMHVRTRSRDEDLGFAAETVLCRPDSASTGRKQTKNRFLEPLVFMAVFRG